MSSADTQKIRRSEAWLHAYHDGELGGLRGWWFERLLAASPSLRAQLEELEALAVLVRESDPSQSRVDLWDSIALWLPAMDAQRAEEVAQRPAWAFPARYARPLAAVALTAVLALALFLGIIRDGTSATPGVIRWLDTGGRSVMVLDHEEGATIVWLLDSQQEGASVRGIHEAV